LFVILEAAGQTDAVRQDRGTEAGGGHGGSGGAQRPHGPGGAQGVDRGGEPARGSAGGAAAVLVGAASSGTAGTAAHYAPGGASSVSLGAVRIVLGGAVLFGLAISHPASRRDLVALVRSGTASRVSLALAIAGVSGYQLCFFSAVRLTGVAVGTVVAIGSGPVLAGLISRLTGGEPLTVRWMIATAGAVSGCALLIASGRAAGVSLDGVGLALAAGLCYAVYAVATGRLIRGGTAERAVMGGLLGGAAVLLLPVLVASSPGWLATGRGLTVALYLGLVATALGYLLVGRGFRVLPAPVVVTLGLAEPLVAALLGLLLLGERLTVTATVGLILVGLALAVLAVPAKSAGAGPVTPASPPAPPPG
jgi:drug/metabolite transporter, DME family